MNAKSFQQFINEESPGVPLSPTHAELEELHWFQSLKRTLNTIDIDPEWTTGKLAYSRGNRKLSVSRDEFIFYPLRGTIINNAFTMRAKLPFDSLEAWNAALFVVYTKVIGGRLGLGNARQFSRAVLTRDSTKITDMFNQLNDHLAGYGIDPRPKAFLFSILQEVSSPEESSAISDLLDLGLM